MKIVLLGTGADECIPAFGCRCPTCTYSRDIGGKNIRQNSSMLIDNESELILFDMPPQIMTQLRNYDIDETCIQNVLFTHRHDDHIAGARYLFQRRKQKGYQELNQINAYMSESTYRHLQMRFSKLDHYGSPVPFENVDCEMIQSYKRFSIGTLTITPLETNHLRMKQSTDECFGYLIETVNGITISYLLDAGSDIPDRTLEIMRESNLDLLITDCTFLSSDNPGHMDLKRVRALQEEVKPGRMIISHIGHSNNTHDTLVQNLVESGIEVGFDGLTIIL